VTTASVLAPTRPSALQSLFKRLVTVQTKEVPATIGVDVGSSAVKIVVLGRRKGNGARPLIAQEQILLSEHPEDLAGAIRAAIERLHLSTRSVALSVSGSSVIMRVVEMPMMNPADLKKALPFEAQRYLPFPVQDVVLDGEILSAIDAKKSWVLVVACKKDLIEQRLDLAKRAGLEVEVLDVDALALANAFLETGTAQRKAPTSAVVNVGAQLTSVVVFKGTTPYLVRDIPWGSERVVRELAQQLGCEASRIKQALKSPEAPAEIQEALKAACESVVVELQLSFDYFENQLGQPPEEVFVTGGLSQSAPFMAALKQHLTQNVVLWEPGAGIPGSCAVAFGLALRV